MTDNLNGFSDEYNLIVTLADDLERLGYTAFTPQGLRNIAEAIETQHVIKQSGFDQMETIEDFSL